MVYEVDELLKFILMINEVSYEQKHKTAKECRDTLSYLYRESNRFLYQSCSARLPGGSAICSRPLNHSGKHKQDAIEWSGKRA